MLRHAPRSNKLDASHSHSVAFRVILYLAVAAWSRE